MNGKRLRSSCSLMRDNNGQMLAAVVGGYFAESKGMEVWNPNDGSVKIQASVIPPEQSSSTGKLRNSFCINVPACRISPTLLNLHKLSWVMRILFAWHNSNPRISLDWPIRIWCTHVPRSHWWHDWNSCSWPSTKISNTHTHLCQPKPKPQKL